MAERDLRFESICKALKTEWLKNTNYTQLKGQASFVITQIHFGVLVEKRLGVGVIEMSEECFLF